MKLACTKTIAFVALSGLHLCLGLAAYAQPAPAPYHISPFPSSSPFRFFKGDGPSENIHMQRDRPEKGTTYAQQQTVGEDGAEWLAIKFNKFNLGKNSTLTVQSLTDGHSQTFDHETLVQWNGMTALFNGDSLDIVLSVSPDDENVFYEIEALIVGEAVKGRSESQPLDQHPQGLNETEAICADDKRVSSNDQRVGRLMPVGCTAWLATNGAILTAGHCIGSRTSLLQFNVPRSKLDGTPVHPAPEDQFSVLPAAKDNYENEGKGRDWAILRVAPHTEGKTPQNKYGPGLEIRLFKEGDSEATIIGYGVDDDPLGRSPETRFRNSSNQTQQVHKSDLVGESVRSPEMAVLEHKVDSRPGGSGSPILVGTVAVGIHTHGNCIDKANENAGTSFRQKKLSEALKNFKAAE